MQTKQDIRQRYKQIRTAMSKYDVASKSAAMSDVFLATDIYKNSTCIMLYVPLGNEADTTEIIAKAHSDGKKVVLPVTDSRTGIITPTLVTADTLLSKGAFSVIEPVGGSVVAIDDIDVVLVPGIVFDTKGARAGFGKGCYDRLLSGYNGIKVGYCYSDQMCEYLPVDEYDVYMDYIVTEKSLMIINLSDAQTGKS